SIPRALPEDKLQEKFRAHGVEASAYPTPKAAAAAARSHAADNDIIYIGGSTFIVADYLQ
ncbi:MAG: bifunctional folylpolyglutamate synthase/dihydrofolate synthase, partial [Muribaculaceae bacterium]|nr:bifunctional folylpolyglutamate synthase/dihydrofolate synthase [Muribaculaceae bacterium]